MATRIEERGKDKGQLRSVDSQINEFQGFKRPQESHIFTPRYRLESIN
jgi:hypothetical protein